MRYATPATPYPAAACAELDPASLADDAGGTREVGCVHRPAPHSSRSSPVRRCPSSSPQDLAIALRVDPPACEDSSALRLQPRPATPSAQPHRPLPPRAEVESQIKVRDLSRASVTLAPAEYTSWSEARSELMVEGKRCARSRRSVAQTACLSPAAFPVAQAAQGAAAGRARERDRRAGRGDPRRVRRAREGLRAQPRPRAARRAHDDPVLVQLPVQVSGRRPEAARPRGGAGAGEECSGLTASTAHSPAQSRLLLPVYDGSPRPRFTSPRLQSPPPSFAPSLFCPSRSGAVPRAGRAQSPSPR